MPAEFLSSQEESGSIDPDDVESLEKPCPLNQNGDFPLRDGNDINYKDVEIGPGLLRSGITPSKI